MDYLNTKEIVDMNSFQTRDKDKYFHAQKNGNPLKFPLQLVALTGQLSNQIVQDLIAFSELPELRTG